MPNKEKKGLSHIMQSSRFKKFAPQHYDLLEEGEELVHKAKMKNTALELADRQGAEVGTESVPTQQNRKQTILSELDVRPLKNSDENKIGTEMAPTDNIGTTSVPISVTVPLYFFQALPLIEMTSREARIFFAIVSICLSSSDGTAEISGNELRDQTKIFRSHIFQTIKVLTEKKLVLREKQDVGDKNLYRINFAHFKNVFLTKK